MKTLIAFLKWLDRRLWVAPLLLTAVAFACLAIWAKFDSQPILIASADRSTRTQVMSSFASSAGSLLGFTIASVTILAAFPPNRNQKGERVPSETRLAKARSLVSSALLTSAALLLTVLILSTVLLATDVDTVGPEFGLLVTVSLAIGSAGGLVIGCAGLALTVAERNRVT